MMNLIKYLVILLLASSSFGFVYGSSVDKPLLHFLSNEKAVEVIIANDDFIKRLSAFDRASRMKTDKVISKEQYLKFLSLNVVSWTKSEIKVVSRIFDELYLAIYALNMDLPDQINFIMTTGKEEGNAAYTRSNAIILQKKRFSNYVELKRIIAHEIFHLYTRKNITVKEKLYNVIGFHKINEIEFPTVLKKKKITNPDAPINNYAIQINYKGNLRWVVPILYSKTEKYIPEKGGEFFEYLQFMFIIVGKGKEANINSYDPTEPKFLNISQFKGFFEKVGQNTKYIIHPEEILADNFSLLALGIKQVKSPEIILKIKNVFDKN